MLASRRRQPPRVARVTTFADLLARRLRDAAGQPLVTWYDHATGERVELSVATYANWVAKTASLLAEEHDAERGGSLRIDLPTHWLGPVFLGAAWTLGLVVRPTSEPDAVVCGPAGLDRWAPEAGRLPVLACSLLPLGVRFAEPLPAGVHDVGVEVWSQPDAFTPWDPPGGQDRATDGLTQDELWSRPPLGPLFPAAAGSWQRRTRLPLPVSPPSSSRWLAAALSCWSRTPTRRASRHCRPRSGARTASWRRPSRPCHRP